MTGTRPEVSFHPRYREWVADGSKTRTARYGDTLPLGPIICRFDSDPPSYLEAHITALRAVPLAELTDDDARAENFASASELVEALRFHYPGLPADAVVTIASFHLDEGPLRPEVSR